MRSDSDTTHVRRSPRNREGRGLQRACVRQHRTALRKEIRDERWPKEVRLSRLELHMLYYCINKSPTFWPRTRHEIAPYAFQTDGGKPYEESRCAKRPLEDEIQAVVCRVVRQSDWTSKIEEARTTMRERAGTNREFADWALRVTESLREAFQRTGLNGEPRREERPATRAESR